MTPKGLASLLARLLLTLSFSVLAAAQRPPLVSQGHAHTGITSVPAPGQFEAGAFPRRNLGLPHLAGLAAGLVSPMSAPANPIFQLTPTYDSGGLYPVS